MNILPASPLQRSLGRHTQRVSVPLSRLVPPAGEDFPTLEAIPLQADISLELLAGLVSRLPPIVSPAEKEGFWRVILRAEVVSMLRAYLPPAEWSGVNVPCLRAAGRDVLPVSDLDLIGTFMGHSTGSTDRKVRKLLREQFGIRLKKPSRERLALLAAARISR